MALSPRLLGMVIATGIAMRLAAAIFLGGDEGLSDSLPDQREYLQIARNILDGRGAHFYDSRFGQEVFAGRTPGYPLFLAMCGGSVRAIHLAQAFIDCGTIFAAIWLARRWLDTRASLVAGACMAVNPFLIYFSGLILSETLYIGLLAWGIACLVRGRGGLWIVGILLLALGAMVRPSGLVLSLLLPPAAALLNSPVVRGYDWAWRAALHLGLSLLVTGAVFYPWASRNAHNPAIGAWIWTTTNGGITLYDGFNDAATGESAQQKFIGSLPELKTMTERQRDEYLRSEAKKWIVTHPSRSAWLGIVKIARTWSPVPLSHEYQTVPKVLVALLYSVPFDVLVLLGLFGTRLPGAAKVFLVIPAVYFTLLHAVSVGSLRYRLPAEVSMSVLAAAAIRPAARGGRTGV